MANSTKTVASVQNAGQTTQTQRKGNYTYYLINENFDGTDTVQITSKVNCLNTFTYLDKNGDEQTFQGTLESLVFLYKQGIIESFTVGKKSYSDDGKELANITIEGFNPEINCKTKDKEWNYFKGCVSKLNFLKRIQNK